MEKETRERRQRPCGLQVGHFTSVIFSLISVVWVRMCKLPEIRGPLTLVVSVLTVLTFRCSPEIPECRSLYKPGTAVWANLGLMLVHGVSFRSAGP